MLPAVVRGTSPPSEAPGAPGVIDKASVGGLTHVLQGSPEKAKQGTTELLNGATAGMIESMAGMTRAGQFGKHGRPNVGQCLTF